MQAAAKAAGTTSNRAIAQFPLPRECPPDKTKRQKRPCRSLCGLLHVLGWRGAGLRFQSTEIIGRLPRVAGGGEDRPPVVFQDFEPGGVVIAGFRRDAKIGA